MRIVTRPDFDGIVCAVLLKDALHITEPIKWVEPNAMQHGLVDIRPGDVIANLAYNATCEMWFDHHESNRIALRFKGVFKIAPSAAGIVFEYFKKDKTNPKPFQRDYHRLVTETDKIDSASLSLEEVLHPESYPYIALSATVKSQRAEDEPYWNRVVDLLRTRDIYRVLEDPEVNERLQKAVAADRIYKDFVNAYTTIDRHVTITDYRGLDRVPSGNRFLVFSLFPEAVVNVKIRFESPARKKVVISLGHSIFNRGCQVSAGEVCSIFGGGGHRGAGSCSVPAHRADQAISTILDILIENKPSSFPILYEDRFLIAVDKPPGLPPESKRVVKYQGRLFKVFPLDRETSGIILFAKSVKVRKALQETASQGEVKRMYYALVNGQPPEMTAVIECETPPASTGNGNGSGNGGNSITRYWLLKTYEQNSLLEVDVGLSQEPDLRDSLSRLGCTVVGDYSHGDPGDPLKRLGLHAYFIAFTHPVSQKRIVLETPVPQQFLGYFKNFDEGS
ncbi:MAG: hypothetical protein GY940_38255 [bacterium]|nr:hypothetical protein [bacterium]